MNAKIVYSAVNHYNSQIAALADGPIQDVKDFKGKQVGVFSLPSGGVPYLKAVLREAGLDPEKDVTMVPTGAGAPALQALNSGTVAALSLWAGAFAVFENQGAKLKIFTSRELVDRARPRARDHRGVHQQNPEIVAKVGRIYRQVGGVRHGESAGDRAGLLEGAAAEQPPEVNDKSLAEQQHILEVGLRDMRVEDRPDKRWGWNDPAGLTASCRII